MSARVLVVEDEFMIGLDIGQQLASLVTKWSGWQRLWQKRSGLSRGAMSPSSTSISAARHASRSHRNYGRPASRSLC